VVQAVEVSLDNGAFTPVNCTGCATANATWTYTPATLADGPHTLVFRSKDNGGATSPTITKSITVDTAAPTYSSLAATGGSTTTTATFSEPLDCTSVAASDFTATVQGSPVAVSSITCSGASDSTIDVVLASAPRGGDTVAVTLAGAVTDPAGNAAPQPTTKSTTATNQAPTITVSTGPSGSTNDNTPDFTGTANDPDGFVVSIQVSVDNGAFAPVTCASCPAVSPTWSYTSGVLADGPHSLVFKAADNAGLASATVTRSITIDTAAPTVTINQTAGQTDPTNASQLRFTVVFSESVIGFAAGDVTITGTAGGTKKVVVIGGGTTYDVAVSGQTDGTVIATIPAGAAVDSAQNPSAASTSTDNTMTYDGTAPTVTINQAAGQADPTATSPVVFTVVFSEPVADFAAGDVLLSGTATRGAPTVTGSGTTYSVSVPVTTDGTVIATVPAGGARDAIGNPNAASTSTDNTITYDATPPAYTSVAASGGNAVVTATFTEPILCSTVATSDFDATVAGIPASVTAVGCTGTSDATIDVTLGTTPASGQTVVLRLKGSVTDPAGNVAAIPVSRSTTAADTTPPTFVSISATNASPTVTANFDEPLLCATVTTSDFTATTSNGGPAAPATIINATCTGSTVTLTLASPVVTGTTVTVTLAGSVSDTANNPTTANTVRSTTV